MTDITTKLRCGHYGALVQELHFEAADELDRLRAEVARLAEANRYLIGISNEAMEDARKYAEAQREIARLREALESIANPLNILGSYHLKAVKQARAALAPVVGVEL